MIYGYQVVKHQKGTECFYEVVSPKGIVMASYRNRPNAIRHLAAMDLPVTSYSPSGSKAHIWNYRRIATTKHLRALSSCGLLAKAEEIYPGVAWSSTNPAFCKKCLRIANSKKVSVKTAQAGVTGGWTTINKKAHQ